MNTHPLRIFWGAASLAVVLLAAAALWYVAVDAQRVDVSLVRSFSVSGAEEVFVVPDVARFTFTVLTEGGEDLVALRAQNTERFNDASEFIGEEGVEKKDIQTTEFSIQPRYQYGTCPREGGVCPPPEIVGYAVRQSARVTVRDFELAGRLLAGVVELGANTVSELTFEVEDEEAAKTEARAKAVAEVREKAESVARTAGFDLGRLLSLSEGGGVVPFPQVAFVREEAVGGAAPPSLEPGTQKVEVRVTAVYEIR